MPAASAAAHRAGAPSPTLAAMTQRPHDPRRLDVAAFAAEGASLQGSWPLAVMPRLLESVDAPSEAQRATDVSWRAAGEQAPPRGRAPRLWLHLAASAEVTMTCQRCLGPVAVPLAVDRRIGFVESEAQAAVLDAESEDDVLALQPFLDLQALVEDELLLTLPLVPRHADCMPPGGDRNEATAADMSVEHPFAALQALRRKAL
jgi:uncharacterized protein